MYGVIHLTPTRLERYGSMMPTLTSLGKQSMTLDEEQALLHQYEGENTRIFAAVQDERIIGLATVCVYENGSLMRATVDDVAVHQHFRHQGIGTAVVQHALAFADEHKCNDIIVFPREEVIPFYETFGFSVQGDYFMRLEK